jgi:hypothetical protein
MRRGLPFLALAALAAALWVNCGGSCRVLLSGGKVVDCGNEPPGPGDPAFGDAAEVLITDCTTGQLLWVGIAAPPTPTPPPGRGAAQGVDVFDELEALRCSGRLNWIGGTVQVADDHPNGFYFDPAAILVFESAPTSIQTTIAAIAQDPLFFAPEGRGGEDQWVVPAAVFAIETSETLQCPVGPPCGS